MIKCIWPRRLAAETGAEAEELLTELNRDLPAGRFSYDRIEYVYPNNDFIYDRICSLKF